MSPLATNSHNRKKKTDGDSDDSPKNSVLTKATLNAADSLGLSGKDLSAIIGLSEPTVVRLKKNQAVIHAKNKDGELAAMLIRIYRSLYALLGSDREQMKAWMFGENREFGKPPYETIKKVDGLVHVTQYLDTMRGQG